jgi:hypothetical protein
VREEYRYAHKEAKARVKEKKRMKERVHTRRAEVHV